MKWYDTFLTRCLDGLPKDKYRSRVGVELEDHLLTLTEELTASGYSPEEARTRAVELMGDPGELNEGFRAQWVRKAEHFRYCVPLFARNILLSLLVGTFSTWFILIPSSLLFPWLFTRDHIYAIYLSLHLIPAYLVGAKEIDRAFNLHPRRFRFVICGIFLSWGTEVLGLYTGYALFSLASAILFVDNSLLGILYTLLSFGSYILFPASCALVASRLAGFYLLLSLAICITAIGLYAFSNRVKLKPPLGR